MALFSSTSISSAAGGYDIDNSCRFNIGDSPRLTRTPSGAGNQKTWTVSFWMKKTSINSGSMFPFSANATTELYWSSSTKKLGAQYVGGNFSIDNLLRDFSAWYHVVWTMDTTQSTDTNRMKFYLNGDAISFTPSAWPALNSDQHVNNTVAHSIGCRSSNADFFDGYISEFHLVDGTALDQDDFGERGDYGEWKAKKYTGSYGTNGFYLDFKSSGSLGNDAAGSNNFTVSNLAASDKMLDSPTNNWCTLNNLNTVHTGLHNHTFKEGNLYVEGPSNGHFQGGLVGTLFTSNKIYYEFYMKALQSQFAMWGIAPDDYNPSSLTANSADGLRPGKTNSGIIAHGVSTDLAYNATYYDGSSTVSATQSDILVGDIVMVAFDPVTGKYWFGRNGNWDSSGNPATGANPIATLTNLNHTWTGMVSGYGIATKLIVNFGQDPTFAGNKSPGTTYDDGDYGAFFYQPPTGFLSLCSKNIPDPAVKPKEHFSVKLYDDGAGAKTGVGFQPDLVWLKASGITSNHHLTDAVRGVTKALVPNESFLEATDSAGLTAFGSDGFTVGTDNHYDDTTGAGMVAWCWKANGSGSSNTDGSINTTATSVNTSAGFSISTYAGNGSAGATIGHGLSVAPNLVIVKRRSSGDGWMVGSIQPLASMDFDDALVLDTTAAKIDDISKWNDTAPTADLVSLGTNYEVNASGHTYVAYCFHNVEGYSKIGSYKGNGNVVGTFVYCGFRPRRIMYKRIDGTGSWNIYDTDRVNNNYNPVRERLPANLSYAAEPSSFAIDVLSNGFKLRTTDAEMNAGNNYMFYAIAETPSKYANAR
jgi:hypothetical protein